MPSRLTSLKTFSRALALVAVDGQNVVGLITAHIIPPIHAAEPVPLLTTLVVASSHRGKGIGSQLVCEFRTLGGIAEMNQYFFKETVG